MCRSQRQWKYQWNNEEEISSMWKWNNINQYNDDNGNENEMIMKKKERKYYYYLMQPIMWYWENKAAILANMWNGYQ